MERLTKKERCWQGEEYWYTAEEPDMEDIEDVYNRLAFIEDILGDNYDLDRLRDLVKADREGRIKIEPKARRCPKCGKHTVFPRIDLKFYYCFSCKTHFSREEYITALKGDQNG